jgi:thiol-disulfide isomerase/thioredoxin
MTEQSRLDSARNEASDAGGEWYRSPLALVAGIILFLGVLALVVLGLTGGDDAAAPAIVPAVAVENEPAPAVPPISFGGVGILEMDAVALVGEPLPVLVPDEDDLAVGTLAPVITATSLASGSPITLGPGRARVIGFFAHWCPHCQDELPKITEWLAATPLPPNTEFIAVSTAVDEGNGNYPPSAWFNDVGFSSPVVVDDASATLLNGMGFGGFPAFVAIDASGVVVARAGGNIGTEGLASLFDNFASAAATD